MLIYHPRNDIFHCVFRVLSILELLDNDAVEFERVKILDFYTVFPHLINSIKFPRIKGVAKLKKDVALLSLPYENLPQTKILFSEMGDFQLQAVDVLRANGICNITKGGLINKNELFNSKGIKNITTNNNITSKAIFFDLVKIFENYPLHGNSGLKARTGLMEYRYDAI